MPQGTVLAVLDSNDDSHRVVREDNGLPIISTNSEYQYIAEGKKEGYSLIHKFGFATITTNLVPITTNLTYFTPTIPTVLEFVSDSTDDSTGGTGATKIKVEGLDSGWLPVSHIIDTNGTTAVVLPAMFRLFRWRVYESGTYASPSQPSYAGNLTLQELGGGTVWDEITNTAPFAGQSEIGAYTVPLGYTAYLYAKSVFVDASKPVDMFFISRDNANDVTAPYSGVRRIIERETGIIGNFEKKFTYPKGKFIGPCDIGFQGVKQSSGTADVSVEFTLLLVQDGY